MEISLHNCLILPYLLLLVKWRLSFESLQNTYTPKHTYNGKESCSCFTSCIISPAGFVYGNPFIDFCYFFSYQSCRFALPLHALLALPLHVINNRSFAISQTFVIEANAIFTQRLSNKFHQMRMQKIHTLIQ